MPEIFGQVHSVGQFRKHANREDTLESLRTDFVSPMDAQVVTSAAMSCGASAAVPI